MIHGEQSWLGAELFGRSIVGEIWRKLSTKWRIGAENSTETHYPALLIYPALLCSALYTTAPTPSFELLG